MGKKNIIIGFAALVALVVVVGLLTSGGKESMKMSRKSSDTVANSSQPQDKNTVEISNFAFKPDSVKIKKGTTITWVNNDPTQHNVIFDDASVGKVENSKLIGKGEKLQYTFKTVGTFAYHCMPHPYMTGSIEVTE